MRYKVTKTVATLQIDRTQPSSKDVTLYRNQLVDDLDEPEETDDSRKVQLDYDDGEVAVGWVLKSALAVDTSVPAMPPLSNFMIACLDAVSVVNQLDDTAPNYASLDFILARANFATSNSYPPPQAGSPFGPFQIRSEEWDDFCRACSLGKNLPADFKDYVTEQAQAAAWNMVTSGRRLIASYSSLNQQHEPTYEPDLLDLFLSYILNNTADAARCRQAASIGNTTPIDRFLVSPQNPELQSLMAGAQASLFVDQTGTVRTVSDVVAQVTTKLDELLTEAYKLIVQLAPQYIARTTGGAPWLAVAKTQIGVLESDDAKIRSYFASIGVLANGATPWCGAFVAWCLLQSKAITSKQLPKVPERAANWTDFGRSIALPLNQTDKSLLGAIVVLSPQAANSSGHVGFLTGFSTPGKVTLLGGNEHDQVREEDFSLADIRAVRWPDFDQTGTIAIAGSQSPVQLNLKGYSAAQKEAALLIVRLFAEAGYDQMHQRIAVANAVRESSLIADKRNNTTKEDSVGLFQLNRKGGQGAAFTVEQLQDPEFNTRRILIQAKSVPAFATEANESNAMTIFIQKVEIAAYSVNELSIRMGYYYALKA
ncbi:CHAP domain-containing protein [Rhizobium sp. BR 314]|uniref:CHAP domain-containing protein n=1 Tax=Rhizobium sp. BR 314 TaxID=3040013 RepID=UPI0039BF776C